MRYRNLLGGLLLALAGTNSQAGDSGFYLGFSVGEATQNNAVFHGEDESIRWLAGYEFSKYFAVEGGFVDGGTQKDNIGSLRVTSSSSGVFLTLLAKYPLGKHFAPYAKFGGVTYETDTTVSNGAATAVEFGKGEDITFGGGLEYKLGDHLRLRADYEKVRVPDVAFDIYSLVASWKF
jgi:OmpA-OmpF porin, OOP family